MKKTTAILMPTLAEPADKCPHTCPGGQPCTCTANVPHDLHICSGFGCACHSRERYEPSAAGARKRVAVWLTACVVSCLILLAFQQAQAQCCVPVPEPTIPASSTSTILRLHLPYVAGGLLPADPWTPAPVLTATPTATQPPIIIIWTPTPTPTPTKTSVSTPTVAPTPALIVVSLTPTATATP